MRALRLRGRRLAAAVFASALLGLAGCGGSSSPAETRWIVLGSSTAAGVGASPGSGWAALLAAEAGSRSRVLDNRARSGAVTYQALPASASRPEGRPATVAALDVEAALTDRAELLILAFPTNDAMAGYAADETVANIELMRERASTRGAVTMVLSSQPRDDASSAQRATMRRADEILASSVGACFVDVAAALAGPGGGISPAYAAGDGVHLNDAGHRLVFDRVMAVLRGGRCLATTAG